MGKSKTKNTSVMVLMILALLFVSLFIAYFIYYIISSPGRVYNMSLLYVMGVRSETACLIWDCFWLLVPLILFLSCYKWVKANVVICITLAIRTASRFLYSYYFEVTEIYAIVAVVLAVVGMVVMPKKKVLTIIACSLYLLTCSANLIHLLDWLIGGGGWYRSIYSYHCTLYLVGYLFFSIAMLVFVVKSKVVEEEKVDVEEELRRLKIKFEVGMITPAEYALKRSELIKKL